LETKGRDYKMASGGARFKQNIRKLILIFPILYNFLSKDFLHKETTVHSKTTPQLDKNDCSRYWSYE